MSGSTDWLMQAVSLLGAFLLAALLFFAAWTAVSPIGYGVRRVAEHVGLLRLLEWIKARLCRWTIQALWAWSFSKGFWNLQGQRSVRYVIDEQLVQLKRTMDRTVSAVRDAASDVEALAGSSGPQALRADIMAVQDRVEAVSKLGGEIDAEAVIQDYRARSGSALLLMIFTLFAIAVAVVNGALLGSFFRGLIVGQVFGIRLSYIFADLVVLLEIANGVAMSRFRVRESEAGFRLTIGIALILALTEAVILGFVSLNVDLDVAFLDDHPALKFWLAPLGLALVAITTVTGYLLHSEIDGLLERRGDARFRKEAKELNDLLRTVPDTWEGIRRKAATAASAMANYEASLGNKENVLGGAIERISTEREAIASALVTARIQEWPQSGDANPADHRAGFILRVGLGILALVFFAGFTFAVFSALGAAFHAIAPLIQGALALILTLASFMIGYVSFGRVHLLPENRQRVYPMRTGRLESAVAAVLGTAAIIAFIVIGLAGFGWTGIAVACVLIAGGAGLAILGYFSEWAIEGIVAIACMLAAATILAVLVGAIVILQVLGWLIWFVGHLCLFLLSIVAWPLEGVILPWLSRRALARRAVLVGGTTG